MSYANKNIKRFNINAGRTPHLFAEERCGNSTPLHWHSHFEIEIILSGEAVCTVNGKKYEVSRGSVYILTPADFHTFEAVKSTRLWHIAFDETVVSERRTHELTWELEEPCFSLGDETLGLVERTAYLLSVEAQRADGGCAQALCECLLSMLFRDRAKGPLRQGERISSIQKALTYMEMHFRENPTLSDMASLSGFNASYFSELFRKATGQSFSERLSRLKIKHAKALLSQGCSITDACYRSGFGSVNNFLRTFKKLEGMPPSEYKKRLAK